MKNNKGFTLIEVVAALIIVSLGMLSIIQAVSQTASNAAYLRDKTFAYWVAMNQLTTVRLAQQPPNTEDTSGDADMAGQKWHWTMTVIQTPVQTMRRIDINVAASDAPKGSALATVTGFYGSAIPKTAALMAWDGAASAVVAPQSTPTTAPAVAPSSGDQMGLSDIDSTPDSSGTSLSPTTPPNTVPPTTPPDTSAPTSPSGDSSTETPN